MSKKEALGELIDEITGIEEIFHKIRSAEWCSMNGYFLKTNPDKSILMFYYDIYREIFFIIDDYLIQMELLFKKLREEYR